MNNPSNFTVPECPLIRPEENDKEYHKAISFSNENSTIFNGTPKFIEFLLPPNVKSQNEDPTPRFRNNSRLGQYAEMPNIASVDTQDTIQTIGDYYTDHNLPRQSKIKNNYLRTMAKTNILVTQASKNNKNFDTVIENKESRIRCSCGPIKEGCCKVF